MQQDDVELKPCPFCESTHFDNSPFPYDRSKTAYLVRCGVCDAEVIADNPEEAVKKWNTRSLNKCYRCINYNQHYHAGNTECLKCPRQLDLLEDKFKERPSPVMAQLFEGAYVIGETVFGDEVPVIYSSGNFNNFKSYRLAKIDESPIDVWLIPWIKIPKELNAFKIKIKYKSMLIYEFKPGEKIKDWKYAVAVMIIDKNKVTSS